MPDFLVIGAPKAGTTALHAALARHPGLYMSAVKEPKFFLSDGPPPTKGGPGDALTYREHIWRRPEYEALFDPAPPGTLRGESTPLYLYDRAAVRRIRDTLPRARLIVVLRDPVERAHSNWTHLWSAGLEPVGDFVRACAEEERRIAAGWASFWHYTGLSRYGEQLEYLFTLFPREQVLVLRYRRLVDADLFGIVIANADGRVKEANDAFLAIIGHDRADLEAGRVRWTASPRRSGSRWIGARSSK